MGVKHKSVREALEYVSRHQTPEKPPIEMPIWELVARHLFEKAQVVGGSRAEAKDAHAAAKIILDRTAGKRRTGTHPAQATKKKVVIADFTKRELT